MRRRIFLPADFNTHYSAGEARLALLHEHAHHRRHDILANFCALLVLALHWWNPLAYLNGCLQLPILDEQVNSLIREQK